jgi:CheY-like chemotaxis protein
VTDPSSQLFDWRALDGQAFQSLALDLLRTDGFDVLDQGVGPDGGVDAIAIQTVSVMSGLTKSVRWAVQAKFHGDTSRAVGPDGLGNIANILARFRADGYLLITNARVTAKAYAELRAVGDVGPPYSLTNVWPQDLVEAKLLEYQDVAEKYFKRPKKRVLVVEDDSEWRELISEVVTALGHEVTSAASASEAKDLLLQLQVDVAILDIRLDVNSYSDMSGFDLGTHIRANWPDARVIYVTANSSISLARIATEAGDGILGKVNFSPGSLEELISREPTAGRPESVALSTVGREMIGNVVHRFGNKIGLARILVRDELESIASDGLQHTAVLLDGLSSDLQVISALAARYPASLSTSIVQVTARSIIGQAIKAISSHSGSVDVAEVAALETDLRCDPLALTEALKSVIVNGLEASSDAESPRVTVSLETHLRHRLLLKLSVSDNGRGVPPGQLHLMYQPGFSTKANGQGLGFYLAVKTVEELGGWVEVESPAGQWSTAVHIWLPAGGS